MSVCVFVSFVVAVVSCLFLFVGVCVPVRLCFGVSWCVVSFAFGLYLCLDLRSWCCAFVFVCEFKAVRLCLCSRQCVWECLCSRLSVRVCVQGCAFVVCVKAKTQIDKKTEKEV